MTANPWARVAQSDDAAMQTPVAIKAIATAVPAYRLDQAATREAARAIFAGRTREFDRLAAVFTNAGIASRYSSVPLDWYTQPQSWATRNAAYLDSALEVLERATHACMARAGTKADHIDAVVAVSSTGIATPSLDALLIARMGLRQDALRLPIFGLGCAGGVIGLARAADLARAHPGRSVLFLVVELCGLSFRADDLSNGNIVASALFGDGAAALLLRAEGEADGPAIAQAAEHSWRDSLDIMGWRVEDNGLGVVFSQSIPALVRAELRPVAEAFLARHGLTLGDLAGVICHPGGAKVLDALADALAPCRDGFDEAWGVLRDYGNMSAATVLFVLERRLAAGAHGRHLMSALGPGFTAGLMLVDL